MSSIISSDNFEKRVLKIRSLIKKSKNPIVFFDTDSDGLMSYFQLRKAFLNIKEGFYMSKDKQIDCLDLINEDVDLIIIFDIPTISEEFFEATKNIPIIWADHHLTNDLKLIRKYNVLHLNPLEFDKNDNRASCYLAYRVSNLKENLPFVSLGSVADFFLLDILIEFYKFDEKLFNQIFNLEDKKREELFEFIEKYKFNDLKKREERENWIRFLTYETALIDFKNLFDLMFKLEDKNNNNLILNSIKNIEKMNFFEIMSNINSGKGELFEDYSLMRKKYKKIFKKALEIKENNLILFEYSGKTSFTRQIAEELSYKFKKYKVILIIFKKTGKEYYSGSFRGNNYDVNNLTQITLKELDGIGGGHKYAAGMRIHKKDYSEFIKRVKLEIGE